MRSRSTQLALLSAAVLSFGSALGAQKVPDLTPYLMADRASEIALARTAAPPRISDSATVLVLGRDGYSEAAHGSNGFTCLVVRSFAKPPDDPDFWNPHISAPHCFNPPAVRSVLPAMLTQYKWVLGGITPADFAARTKKAYADKTFSMPAAGSMVYMLSPKQNLGDPNPHWMPHLMFYYDASIPGNAFGATGKFSDVMIDASGTSSTDPVRVMLIPTRTWSDGTPATQMAGGN